MGYEMLMQLVFGYQAAEELEEYLSLPTKNKPDD